MRRYALVLAVLAGLAVAGCGGGSSGGAASSSSTSAAPTQNPNQKVTITYWNGFSQRELGIMKKAVAGFERTHPNIEVNTVGSINDDKITASIRSGNPPDVALSFTTDNTGAFCRSGGFQNLGPYISRDHVEINQIPPAVQSYTQYKGNRCVMPVLADAYGLYYNVDMLKKAGITSPPKTISELTADAKKLTVRNPDGSIKVAGFDPYLGFYENAPSHFAPSFNAQWQDASGKSTVATNPGWTKMANWIKGLVDWYGNDKLVKFNAGAGDEFSASNAFETGKLAMAIDGEYRTAFLAAEHPELRYGTAPFPADDGQPSMYGGGYTTGNIIGIPKGAKHPAAAWELIKYLATDSGAEIALADGLKNVPTWKPALASPQLQKTPQYANFLKFFASPATQTTPITPEGSTNQTLLQNYLEKYQAGKGGDLQSGLQSIAKQTDAAAAQANTGSNVP